MSKTTTDVIFAWQNPNAGHEWHRKGRWEGAKVLVPDVGRRSKVTEYVPGIGLFRIFANVPIVANDSINTSLPTRVRQGMREREIKAFAKDYGDIIARPLDDHLRLTTKIEKISKHATMKTWCRSIQHMRRAVDLWDDMQDVRLHRELERLFTRPRGAILYWRMHHPLERMSPPHEQQHGGSTCVPIAMGKEVTAYPSGDVLPLARKALQYEIQSALTDTETPSHTTPCIVTPTLDLMLHPVNLLAFMWMSFARVVSGEIEERRCQMFDTCHNYIYVGRGPGLQREDTTTCGAACRQKKKRQDAKKTRQ